MEPPASKRRRISSSAADIEVQFARPGSIKINSTGAHIADHEDSDGEPVPGEEPDHSFQQDIRLPNQTEVVSHVAVDIGGSLAKVVYFTHSDAEPGGRLHFISFETNLIDQCIEFLRALQKRHRKASRSNSDLSIQATGGGAYKFYDRIRDTLGIELQREDEMECLIIGLDFFITQIPLEVFTFNDSDPANAVEYQPSKAGVYPYLLVNIGSGVSMIKVSGPSSYQRIGGTSLGGGTFWGLLSLLTGARTFDEMLAMAEKGDNSSVDLLVGDIYGKGMGYEKIGLGERTIASSFGKVLQRKRNAEQRAEDGGGLENGSEERASAAPGSDGRMFPPEDLSRSLLYAISNNIGQVAYLQSEKHDLARIYFGGSFIRGHRQTIHTLSFAIKFWSKGSKQAYFLRHEGYLGAVGAFLKRRPVHWVSAIPENSIDDEC
ncbi:fumble-domain-containing protein [Piedraia hortae CBS 480.64]|uniref:Fumble-domain-containing protein n=1 Tax=Piedraia hortae CBS 480.64 TaxID=1314780 RepID=A0A6A7CB36_9PEZI|nr:fumble-domain-containing protein [Piedraia hortae CBS 480.64]